ncbi:putative bifunctional diguanylate cyclase/phosphodiesterase [Paenibacillus cremeus]|uniref:EAL domain-containing protein n=1 Tax=Paenibacillus cremeus TaxID=2163881 RepID=A0A559K045_9BACL|nr:EAL domain-containing protein [Paenibacillus cremeus]TVY05501.1 EAL domain-containing protein [Paenibacillus cremeus]
MVSNQNPRSTGTARMRALRDFFFQNAYFLRLWLVFIGTEIVIMALRQLAGQSIDGTDYIGSAVVVLCSIPILYFSVMNDRIKPVRMFGLLLLLMILVEAVKLMVRGQVLHTTNDWCGSLADIAGGLLLALPLLNFVIMDIRHREFTERQLTYLAYHDVLTGLPNRQMFQQSLSLSIRGAKASGRQLAVMFIDLSRFNHVNDTFGHTFGDKLLIEAAERLKAGLHAGDRVSRQGGDEFTILVEDIESAQDAEKIASKLIKLLGRPFKIEGHEMRVGCSIGIAMYPLDGEDAVTLMKNADNAMYRAKERGKNNSQFYKPEMNETVIQKLVMEEWLNKALEQDEFVLYYQPQIDIFSSQMNGMEALIRWNHPSLGFISPGEFIPLAEETGLIIPLGNWVLRTACMQNKYWQRLGFTPLKMAVNISPIQFHQPDFVNVVLDALNESGLEPRYLELEITEGIAMHHVDQVIEKLQTLRDLGIHISMDDFGTGYSSLNYLKKFPINKLKIAQQFVRDIGEDPDDAAIVHAIMAMAHSLKLNVIAEGVETEEQLAFLLDANCREIQGYIYSKPIPSEDFTALLKRIPA